MRIILNKFFAREYCPCSKREMGFLLECPLKFCTKLCISAEKGDARI
jgi:hypothetical protein